MHEVDFAPEEFEPCDPVFVETADGYVLSESARRVLAWTDPPEPTVADRLVVVRAQLTRLAADLPAAARVMEPHDLLDAVEVLQAAVNLAGSCDQAVVAELDRKAVHESTGATSTAALLAQQLRVRPGEAKPRVATARGCAQRIGFTGEVLAAVRSLVAAAQAAGDLSTDHAHTIDRALNQLPVGLPVAVLDAVEASLVEAAEDHDPTDVAKLGRDLRDVLDPDGPEPRDAQRRRRRDLRISTDDDGSGILRGELTADLLVKLQTVLSPLAAPRPADGNGDDTRSPGQRMHDALEEVCDRLLRSGTLPDSGGAPARGVTISHTQLQEQTGRVTTHHGGDLSMAQLLHLACEAEIIPVVLNDAGGVMSYGRSRRLATPAQSKALAARDHGPTAIATMTLLCAYHHHMFEAWGWDVVMNDGVQANEIALPGTARRTRPRPETTAEHRPSHRDRLPAV